ncbi:MAG: hypothetical protein H7146_08190 [Burkholderiaceae bacterium]|nr:hypothetical protein [Microbacteriaceae bacterium]
MSPRPPARPGRTRSIGAWVIAISGSVLALIFLIRLTRDPSELVSWFGFLCFGFAAAGSIVTITLERRSR